MTASNNPENQKPNGLHDLGQIEEKTPLEYVLEIYRQNYAEDPRRRPLPFCIIRDPGTRQECLVGNFATWRNAMNYIERHFTDDDCHRHEIFQYTASFHLTKEWTR